MNVSDEEDVMLVSLAAVVVVVVVTGRQHAVTSDIESLLHVVAAHSALALVLS